MARISPRSKRALFALAVIAGSAMLGDALAVQDRPIIATIGGILMWAGPLAGLALLVVSVLTDRQKAE